MGCEEASWRHIDFVLRCTPSQSRVSFIPARSLVVWHAISESCPHKTMRELDANFKDTGEIA